MIDNFLKELQLTEGRGTGFPAIYESMEDNGSPKPTFETDDHCSYFLAIIPAHPLADKTYTQSIPGTSEVLGLKSIEDIVRLANQFNQQANNQIDDEKSNPLTNGATNGVDDDIPNEGEAGEISQLRGEIDDENRNTLTNGATNGANGQENTAVSSKNDENGNFETNGVTNGANCQENTNVNGNNEKSGNSVTNGATNGVANDEKSNIVSCATNDITNDINEQVSSAVNAISDNLDSMDTNDVTNGIAENVIDDIPEDVIKQIKAILNKDVHNRVPEVLTLLQKKTPRAVLFKKMRITNQTFNRKRYLDPLLGLGWIEKEFPEKQSTKQTYIITEAGKIILALLNKLKN